MDKQAIEFILGGIDEGTRACIDLAKVFLDVGDLVMGKQDAVGDETIRRFRLVADIVDPPPGKEDGDDRQRVIAGIREARIAVDAFEKSRSRAVATRVMGLLEFPDLPSARRR
jgi:hypothetical protein